MKSTPSLQPLIIFPFVMVILLPSWMFGAQSACWSKKDCLVLTASPLKGASMQLAGIMGMASTSGNTHLVTTPCGGSSHSKNQVQIIPSLSTSHHFCPQS
jgi:hypothetical protein